MNKDLPAVQYSHCHFSCPPPHCHLALPAGPSPTNDMSHSLPELVTARILAHEVDTRGGLLQHADLTGTE